MTEFTTDSLGKSLQNRARCLQKTEINQSAYLVSALDAEKVLNAFKGMYVTANGKSAVITGAEIEKAAFPWQRLFDCQIETNCSANEIQLN